MGTRRRESSSKLILRLAKAVDDRETLMPCLACKGVGRQIVESNIGTYRQTPCQWCHNGMTDRITARMFARWLRILEHNQRAGRCQG
jgi:hypothetical protein